MPGIYSNLVRGILVFYIFSAALVMRPLPTNADPEPQKNDSAAPYLSHQRDTAGGNNALSIFGAEIISDNVQPVLTASRAQEAGLNWTRNSALRWAAVESAPGQREWDTQRSLEAQLEQAALHGLTPILVVRGTPSWAQQVAGASCGPIRPSELDEFAAFLGDAVERYSQPPYNVKYWELWNEPDIAAGLVPGDSQFGCWGNTNDPYYGGRTYGRMLRTAYAAIKAADPEAQVVMGGLLLDCDPTNPSGQSCLPGKFLEGILVDNMANGGPAFDMVSYHGFAFWYAARLDWDQTNSKWSHRGGVTMGKLDFIRSVLKQFNVERPVVLSESGLACHESASCNDNQIEADKANYAIRLYTRGWAYGLEGVSWYSLDDNGNYRELALLRVDGAPRPAFNAIRFLANTLEGARYHGSMWSPDYEGYTFRNGATQYNVMWTNDTSSVPVTLRPGARVFDKLGQNVTPANGILDVTFEPVVVENGGFSAVFLPVVER